MNNEITSFHWQKFPHRYVWCTVCTVLYIKIQCASDSRLYNLGPVIQIAYFSQLNVNVKTDSGTDGCSASVQQHSRWEVSASQPHIHFALHSSCKSKLEDFFCLPISLPPSRLLNLASLIVSWGSTSCSLINQVKNTQRSRIARLVDILLFQNYSVDAIQKMDREFKGLG